jgi:hypothetical protein
MRTLLALSIAAGLAVASGCSEISVNSRLAPDANLSQYRTFAFVPPASGQEQPMTITSQAIEGALTQDLSDKGITPAQPGTQPDFLIGYHVMERQKLDVNYWGYFAYPDVYSYTEGTIMIDFVDPKTHRVFWHGTASGAVQNPGSPDPQRVADAVGKVVNKYPYSLVAGTQRPTM